MDKLLKQSNLATQEIRVFKSLLKSGGATVSEIAKTAKMKRTSCQEVMRSLEDKGLVVRSKLGNKYFYQTEDPDVFAQIVNEREFLVDKLIHELNQKPKHKPWSVRSLAPDESKKIMRRAKRKGEIESSFKDESAKINILADNRIILESKDEDNQVIELRSEELATFHRMLLKS
mgnify:CR=1 FL=1